LGRKPLGSLLAEKEVKAAALMYSLIGTTKIYDLNPRDYLSYVFMRVDNVLYPSSGKEFSI
jgi:hypothetical protein